METPENQNAGNIVIDGRSISEAQLSKSLRPKLYVIFADNPHIFEDDEPSLRKFLEEIKTFGIKTGMPCYVVSKKILFYEGDVIVHRETTNEIIQTLNTMNISTIHRGDSDDEEEFLYFKRMVENLCDNFLLPVIVSLGNGKALEKVLDYAMEKDDNKPIIFFKTSGDDASVLTDLSIGHKKYYKGLEHQFKMEIPWKREEIQPLEISIKEGDTEPGDEIIFLSDLLYEQSLTFDAMLCFLLIGVLMASESDKKCSVFGKLTNEYSNALSMYLLKEGKWKIPKDNIEMIFFQNAFNKKSIEYIGEKTVEKQISDGLWTDLLHLAKGKYLPPAWTKTIQKVNECKDPITVSENDHGLILYALLIHKHYNGAIQWIRTGFVSVRDILVGAFIVQQKMEKWQTGQNERDYLELMHKTLTQDALRIISCIYEADSRHAVFRGKCSEETLLHSGRILLNHECLFVAVETGNKMFVENEVVKDILNEMSYGKERLTKIKAFSFVLIFNCFLFLPMLIFLDSSIFERFYRESNTPFMKVLNAMFGFGLLLIGFAYMLLFDHEQGISNTDIFLIICMTSFFINEIKQLYIAKHRNSVHLYRKNFWNILDWLVFLTYSIGMLLKIKSGFAWTFDASKMCLILTFIFLSIRILHLFCISKLLGPKLAIIKKMSKDTKGFMAIMMIITMCYNISYYAMLYSGNSELSYDTFEKVMFNGYWMLFGELNLEGDKLTEPDCSNLKEVYSSGKTERCPSALGRNFAPYIKAVYGFVAVIMMLNLLIAIYSKTVSNIHVQSKFHWSRLQISFLEEYSLQSIFPFHMQLFSMLPCFFHLLYWIFFGERAKIIPKDGCGGNAFWNQHPKFFRVFLYDTNFDIQLTETKTREDLAALRANIDVDIEDRVQLTTLKEEVKEVKQCIVENNRKMRDEFQSFLKVMGKSENQNNRFRKGRVPRTQWHAFQLQDKLL